MGTLELSLYRLKTAFTTWPTLGEWGVTLLLFAAFAFATLIVLRFSSLFRATLTTLSVRNIFLLAVIAIFTPSLLEETFYRVLLLPHPSEASALDTYLWLAVSSLILFIVAHPLLAWTLWPWARPIFYRPAFLLIVFGLGSVCTLAYSYTGSVWSAVFIHWATIIGWKFLFGGPDFNLSEKKATVKS